MTRSLSFCADAGAIFVLESLPIMLGIIPNSDKQVLRKIVKIITKNIVFHSPCVPKFCNFVKEISNKKRR